MRKAAHPERHLPEAALSHLAGDVKSFPFFLVGLVMFQAGEAVTFPCSSGLMCKSCLVIPCTALLPLGWAALKVAVFGSTLERRRFEQDQGLCGVQAILFRFRDLT